MMKCLAFDLETEVVSEGIPPKLLCGVTVEWDSVGESVGMGFAAIRWAGAMPKTDDGPLDSYGCFADRMSDIDASHLFEYIEARHASGVRVYSYNGLGFDFRVLGQAANAVTRAAAVACGHRDVMFELICRKGYGTSLLNAGKGIGLDKSAGMDGKKAAALWDESPEERSTIMDYCAQDAALTANIVIAARLNKRFSWLSKAGKPMTIPLGSDDFLTCSDAYGLWEGSPPDRSWMSAEVMAMFNPDRAMAWAVEALERRDGGEATLNDVAVAAGVALGGVVTEAVPVGTYDWIIVRSGPDVGIVRSGVIEREFGLLLDDLWGLCATDGQIMDVAGMGAFLASEGVLPGVGMMSVMPGAGLTCEDL